MQRYEVKRTMQKQLKDEFIEESMSELFGGAKREEGRITASYGALERIECWIDGKQLCVETRSRKDVSDQVASDTIARYNRFLERVTGYSSKERRKKAMKS